MKYYDKLLMMGCFTLEDVCAFISNIHTAKSMLLEYSKKGYVRNVKRNLYVALDLVSKESVASKYQIASKITDTSYVSYHSAFEYYGFANQVSNEVLVSSDTRFSSFSFDGITYSFVKSKIDDGVVEENKIRVTTIERTLLDNIDAFSKHMGLEELLRCVELIPSVNEIKLLHYLKIYNKQFLYQKTGYFLNQLTDNLQLSEYFFDECKSYVGESKRYLELDLKYYKTIYNKLWQLIVPENLELLTSKGAQIDAYI